MHKRLLQLLRDNAKRTESGLRMEPGAEAATLYLYDVIDPYFGVSALDFNQALTGLNGQKVNLHINSPGGDVFEARAMATAIARHGDVTVWIDGLAASAATYVALAGKKINISEGAFFMIHEAWTLAYGNKNDLTATAALLDKIDQSILADYGRKTGQTSDQITAWMAAETWFNATEALANGFVDAVVPVDSGSASNRAAWNLGAYEHAPQALTEPTQPPEPEIEPLRTQAARRLRLLSQPA